MLKIIDRLTPNKTYAISIGSNAHDDRLGYAAETESINALKGIGKNIHISFKIGDNGQPYAIKAQAI